MLRINSPCRYRPLSDFLSFAAPYRIAMGPQQGRKVFTLQTLPDCGNDQFASRVGNVAGFSLHAGVAAGAIAEEAHERPSPDWSHWCLNHALT
jgi:hypothetical protein